MIMSSVCSDSRCLTRFAPHLQRLGVEGRFPWSGWFNCILRIVGDTRSSPF